MNPILVSISCTAYNQQKYIKDTLEGFIMQKTNFRFEAIVHDDASTDDTVSIIREYAEKYPNIIKPIFETENQYSKNDGSLSKIMTEACTGKYVAFCEGDDFWTDPYKLQKQVDFMESHPNYSMCCTDAYVLTNQGYNEWFRFPNECDISVERMIRGGGSLIFTCTQMYRREHFNLFETLDFCTKCSIGDYCHQILASLEGNVHFFNEKTATYRYDSIGSWTERSNRECVQKQIPGWISQIVMLQGFDKYSKQKYHSIFYETECSYISWLCRNHPSEYTYILKELKKIVRLPFFSYIFIILSCKKEKRTYLFLLNIWNFIGKFHYKYVKILKFMGIYERIIPKD